MYKIFYREVSPARIWLSIISVGVQIMPAGIQIAPVGIENILTGIEIMPASTENPQITLLIGPACPVRFLNSH